MAGIKINLDPSGLEAGTARADSALNRMKGEARSATKGISELEASLITVGNKTGGASQRLSGMTSVLRNSRNAVQNVAFQVGDFAVQVGAGTAASVALGQQLPQLLGGFGVLGAVLGAVVAIGIPLAAMLFGINNKAKTLTETISELKDATAAYHTASNRAAMSTAQLTAKFGSASTGLRAALDLLKQLAADKNRLAVEALTTSLGDFKRVTGSGFAVARLADFFNIDMGEVVFAFTEAGRKQRKALRIALNGFQHQQAILKSAGNSIEVKVAALDRMIVLAQELAAKDGVVTATESHLFKRLADARVELEALLGATPPTTPAGASAETLSASREILGNLRQQVDLQTRINRFGEDSAAVTVLRARYEREAFKVTLASKGIVKEMADELMREFDVLVDLNAEAKRLKFKDGITGATEMAKRLGISLELARKTVALMDKRAPTVAVFDPRNPRFAGKEARLARVRELMPVVRAETVTATAAIAALGGAAGGAGGGVAKLNDAIAATPPILTTLNYQSQQVGNTFRTAFVSMVTHTNTLRGALSQLLTSFSNIAANAAFDSLFGGISKSISLGGIGDFIGGLFGAPTSLNPYGSANGNVFDHGNVVPFATGGVVNRPTMFPINGGRTGMMGEAGPEAIMPLTRGPGGKLGVRASGGGATQQVHVVVSVNNDGTLAAIVDDRATAAANRAAIKTTSLGIDHFSRNLLPARVSEISGDPRRRG